MVSSYERERGQILEVRCNHVWNACVVSLRANQRLINRSSSGEVGWHGMAWEHSIASHFLCTNPRARVLELPHCTPAAVR